MSWLDLIVSAAKIKINGVLQSQPATLNITGSGVTSAVSGDQLDVAIASGSVTGSTSILVSGGVASCIMGTSSGTVCDGADARLSDARTPTTHNHPIETFTATSSGRFSIYTLVKRAATGIEANNGVCSEGIATVASTNPGQSITVQTKGLITLPDTAFAAKPTGGIGNPVFANGSMLTYIRDTTPGNSFEQVGTIWFADGSANTTIVNIRLGSLGYNTAI